MQSSTIFPAKLKTIRQCGFDERWLQDQLTTQPQLLCDQLNDDELQVVDRERRQSSGGRLDLLLHDPDADTMYEVELMLGETDETHIVRCIEYWDIEKKRWPRKSHVAVLIAERINTRFYNVINLLSHALPIVGIQANIVSVEGRDALHLTKIVDSFEEAEVETDGGTEISADHWRKQLPAQYACLELVVGWLNELRISHDLVFHQRYVSIGFAGRHRVWLSERSNGRVSWEMFVPPEVMTECGQVVTAVAADARRYGRSGMRWMTNRAEMSANVAVYKQVLPLLVPAEKRSD